MMSKEHLQHQPFISKSPGLVKRKGVRASQEALFSEYLLSAAQNLPLVVQPAMEGIDLISWIANNQCLIEERLARHGGVLFRNFDIAAISGFEQFITAATKEAMNYHEGASPRTQVSNHVYTSTDYPADQSIFLHNELAYRNIFPLKIFFFCSTSALEGGETPIADVRRVFERIDPVIRKRFEQKGWMLVRNYGDGFGLSWQSVFHTTEKAVVEQYCRSNNIDFRWKNKNRLRTWQVRRAVATHPYTGDKVWFNHIAFFHVLTREPSIRDALLREFEEEDLPTNTYYGDGSTIEPAVLEEISEAYRQETITFSWCAGDILMLDNLLVAHGRAPFVGPRKVLVGMAEPFNWDDIQY